MHKNLIRLVEKLRQEQEFISFYKGQIQQSVQELNNGCDQVFHSLWLGHTLSYGLHRVLTHNSYAHEWSHAYLSIDAVKFVNASKVVSSYHFVDRYSKFFTELLNSPELLSCILHHVESEGLDCSWMVNDLMSVVYGHCMFKNDHMLFLKLMRELLRQHIDRCESPKDLFGGVESVFNHVLTEYCSQLVELRTFLTEVLHDPVMQVLACEEYLEYDVNKAGSRFQKSSFHNGLVNSSAFMFSEDLESSCKKLAKLATQFLKNLSMMSKQLPISLQWLLGNLKTMVKHKWPKISLTELRRPISDAVFSSILSSVVVNPENYGVVPPSVVISEMGRYNLSQIMSVLQGCVWIMDKASGSKYPIHKVVRRMDVDLFFSLVDGIDGGLSDSIPDLPSFLPGLSRSTFLASKEQLDNLVGLVALLVTNREGKGNFHTQLSNLLSYLLPAMIDQGCHSPYQITSKALPYNFSSPPNSMDHEKARSLWRKNAKKHSGGSAEMLNVGSSMAQYQQREKGVASHQGSLTEERMKSGTDKHMKRSVSSDTGLSSSIPTGFRLPDQVLVFPFLDQLLEGEAQWDFYLLSEEEFMGQKSPSPKSEDHFHFASVFLNSNSITQQEDFSSPSNSSNERGNKHSKLSNVPQGRVQSMIDTFERSRSNTFPSILSNPVSKGKRTLPAKDSAVHSLPLINGRARRVSDDCTNQSDSLKGVSINDNDIPTATPGSDKVLTRPFSVHCGSSIPLSTTFEASLEDTVSYVKVQPPSIDNGCELSGQQGEEKVRELNKEQLAEKEERGVSEKGLENNMERVNIKSPSSSPDLQDTSDELDIIAREPLQSESLQNLFLTDEGGEEGRDDSPKTKRAKQKKKKKWRLFKKKKSIEELEVIKTGRSQSDYPIKKDEVNFREDKIRSVSHDTVLDGKKEPMNKKIDRYTVYMLDYKAKLEERKKLSPNRDTERGEEETLTSPDVNTDGVQSTSNGLNRLDVTTPPAEMSPLTFKKSLYCNQLKYKLRYALQSIHTPLTLSPAFLQLQAENSSSQSNARYQLVLLIQHSQQRSRWKQDDIAVALLSEILRMVEPLPNELIEVTIEGVLEDYHSRSSYIAYLVHSQQKFQDAKMQVAAVQESINRIMHINKELFTNFAVRMFLESPGQPRLPQLKSFLQQMESLFLADEKCTLMTNQLANFKTAISEDTLTWENWKDMNKVLSCLSNYLFTYVHQHVFYPNGPTDKEVDRIFYEHLATLSKSITVNHRSLQIPFVYHSGCPWMAAQKQLRAMAAYKSPRGKLHCIVQSLRILISLLQYAKCGDPPGADDLFPVLVYVLIKSNPPATLSTCQFIRNFAESALQGEDAYWWAQFSSAVEFTKTLS